MLTTPEDATQAIEMHLAASVPGVPVQGMNVSFTPTLDTPWLRLQVQWSAAQLWTMPQTSTTRHIGAIYVDIYVPLYDGLPQQLALAALVRAAFHRREFSGVRCEAATGLLGSRTDPDAPGIWYAATVQIPCTIEERVL